MNYDVCSDNFRRCLGKFATGITVVTGVVDNKNYGITVNSFNSVSLDPPLVLFSLEKSAKRFGIFSCIDRVAINFLSEGQRETSLLFSRYDVEHWNCIEYQLTCGLPVLKEALAVVLCAVHSRYEGGDHLIIVCRVFGVNFAKCGAPLVYYGGQYRKLYVENDDGN